VLIFELRDGKMWRDSKVNVAITFVLEEGEQPA
jgi:hypothetical protein